MGTLTGYPPLLALSAPAFDRYPLSNAEQRGDQTIRIQPSYLKAIMSCVLTAALLSGAVPAGAMMQVCKTPGGLVVPLNPGGGTAGSIYAQQKGFLSEMDFNLGALGKLSMAPTLPSVIDKRLESAPALSADAALLFLTGTVATAANREDHESRQVLIEYMARPSIRDDVERAMLAAPAAASGASETVAKLRGKLYYMARPGIRDDVERAMLAAPAAASRASETVAKLRGLRRQLESMGREDRRVLIEGLANLRGKLYTSTSKPASVDGTREHLARLFEGAGGAAVGQAVPVVGADLAGRSPSRLLRPADAAVAEPRTRVIPSIPGVRMPPEETAYLMDAANANIITDVLVQTSEMHLAHPTVARLALGLAKRAEISGIRTEGPTTDARLRHSEMSKFLEVLVDLRQGGDKVVVYQFARAWIGMRLIPIDTDKELFAALKAVVGELGDRFSEFMDPDEAKGFADEMSGSVSGIGVLIDPKGGGGGLGVGQVFPGGPAEKVGLEAGDRILEADGKPIQGFADRSKILGKTGSEVSLKIRRGDREFTVIVTRAQVEKPNSVFGEMISGHPGVAYLKIDEFDKRVTRNFERALVSLKEQGMTSLILDVRYNPGGDTKVVDDVVSMFLKKGQTSAYIETGGQTEPLHTNERDGAYSDLPLVVLANGYSASSAEILTAGLRDNGRAVFMGKKTWGKGIVQSIMPMAVNPMNVFLMLVYRLKGIGMPPLVDAMASILKLTTFRWLTPLKRCIQGLIAGIGGVVPDIELEMDLETEKTVAKNMAAINLKTRRWDPAVDPWIMKAVENLESRP